MRASLPAVALALLTSASLSTAQGPAPVTLQGGVALTEQFTSVSAIVELANGALLIYDLREKRIVRVDPRTNAVTNAATIGSGPLEFKPVGQLLRDPRGGAIFVDLAQHRILRFDANGKPTGTISLGASPLEAMTLGRIFGVDRQGRLYAAGSHLRMPTREAPSLDLRSLGDSVPLLRISTTGARRDTLRWVPSELAGTRTEPTPTGMRMIITLPDGRPSTVYGVLSDGSIVSIDPPEYRLRVRTPDGRSVVGPLVPFTPIPLTAAARAEAIAEAKSGADSIKAESKRNQARMKAQFPPGTPMPPIPDIEGVVLPPKNWSATIEPWGGLNVSATDLILVRVPREYMGGSAHTDVLSRDGRLLGRIKAPKGEGIMAVGALGVYTFREDADELMTIVRYPLPQILKR